MDKAAIKRDYKETKQPMGLYAIRISQHDKIYIGFATNLQARFNRHKTELKFGSHRNQELQELWNSLGEQAFEFETLDVLEHKEDAQSKPDEELRTLAEMWAQKLEQNGDSVAWL